MPASKFGQSTVSVTFAKNVSADNVHAAINSIFSLHGCLACGLGGIDINLRSEEVEIPSELKASPSVKSVTVETA